MIPFLTNAGKRSQYVVDSPLYSRTQRLDIWLPERIDEPAPVLMFIPGGAWTIGDRRGQGYGLMSHMCDQGWICAAINYRTAPFNRWPAPFEDVSVAWAWVVNNIAEYGGDINRIAVAGVSAGGHMASLLGLIDPIQPDAVVSM